MRNIFGSLHGKSADFGRFLSPRPGRKVTVESHFTSSPPEPHSPDPAFTPIAGEEHATSSQHLKGYGPKKPSSIQVGDSLDHAFAAKNGQHSGSNQITPAPQDLDKPPQAPSKYSAVGKSVPAGTLLTPRGLASPTAESRSTLEIEVGYGDKRDAK